MAVPPQGAGGVTALSGLAIDVAKDWSGYAIKNLGTPVDAGDAARKADLPFKNVTSQSADYTASDGDVVLADASGGAITITMPSPSANAWVEVKKTDSSANAVTVDGGGNNIDGAASFDITTQYESYTMVSDGSDWFIV